MPTEQPELRLITNLSGDGEVEIEALVDGWCVYSRFMRRDAASRLVELRIFPAERRPFLPVTHHATGGDPAQPTLDRDGQVSPEFGGWSGDTSALDAMTSGSQINAALLKRVPLDYLRAAADEAFGMRRRVYSLIPSGPEWEAMRRELAMPDMRSSDLTLARFAARYVDLSDADDSRRNPRAALADELEWPVETVRDHLTRAKRAGVYEPLGQGRRGGRLTTKGLDILERAPKPQEGDHRNG